VGGGTIGESLQVGRTGRRRRGRWFDRGRWGCRTGLKSRHLLAIEKFPVFVEDFLKIATAEYLSQRLLD
jgi:hypothetical protein